MRTFAVFVGLIFAALAVVALLAYPAWLAVAPLIEEPRFHRIASRLAMLALVIGFLLVARRLSLADRTSLGYGVPPRTFLRELGIALALGVGLMLPIVAIMTGIGLRDPRAHVPLDFASVAGFAAGGLASGLAVAFIEETFLRGAMFTGIARESGTRAAILLTSFLYAALHFFAKARMAPEDIGWGSGVDLIAGWLLNFGAPLALLDSFLALFAVGVLLATIRAITGNIAACIGLHAGWVLIIAVVRETSVPDAAHPWSFLAGSHDGFVGWLVLAWTVLIGVPIVAYYRRKRTRTAQTS
jgi:membrane protease YdiL (CAAX protease family)